MATVRVRHLAALLAVCATAIACNDVNAPDNNPVPVLYSASPDGLEVAGSDRTIELEGESFTRSARARWNGEDRETEFVSATRLRMRLLEADVAGPRIGLVEVYNPPPGGGTSGSLQVGIAFALPTVTSVSPAKLTLGDTTTILTIEGSGFGQGSSVILRDPADPWSWVSAQTTYVTATRLTARILGYPAHGGAFQLQVGNPAPGGGSSAPVPFALDNPLPELVALSPDSLLSDASNPRVTLRGRRFVTGAQAHWNGSARTTTLVNDSVAYVDLQSSDLTPGNAIVDIRNGAPGGGTSNAVSFRVAPAPPRITSFAPGYASAGDDAFTLTLTGSNFAVGATVTWNAETRIPVVVNSSTLRVAVSAQDVASAGTIALRVNDPATGKSSESHVFPVVTPDYTITSTVSIPLKANDIAWDPLRQRLLASVAGDAPAHQNRIVDIDPLNGSIVQSVLVGSDPGPLAVSHAATYLYAGLRGAPRVSRIELSSFAIDLEINFEADEHLGSAYPEDIVALPGAPQSFAVSLMNICCSPRHLGVAMYDHETRRPTRTQGHTGSNRITRGRDGSELYGYNNETTEFGLRRISVSASGLTETENRGGLLGRFNADIEYDQGLLFGSTGAVVDAATLSLRGTLATSGLVWPDVSAGRVFVFNGEVVNIYSPTSLTLIGTPLQVPEAQDASRMIRWGADGLAFLTSDAIVLVRSPGIGN